MDAPLELRGRRVTVVGLGRFGGGIGAVRFLAARGARIAVTDLAAEEDLRASLEAIAECRVERLCLGRHDPDDFLAADLLVVSPGVPRTQPLLVAARAQGVPVASEMNLFFRLQRGHVAAVTGSNGKSTTTAMLHAILSVAGLPCRLGGNIGKSLLPEVDDVAQGDWSVLELSSFQLEDLDELRLSPEVAVVTNFTPNHLDRHGTLEAYRTAKQTILRWQHPTDTAVLNADDPDVRTWPVRGRRLLFGRQDPVTCCAAEAPDGLFGRCEPGARLHLGDRHEEIPLGDWLTVPGAHNKSDAQAAALAALAIGVGLADVERGLRGFEALPHRLQTVVTTAGRRFVNDSIATTPESVLVALDAFDERPIVLLAGGYDKRIDLDPLARRVAARCKAVALLGQVGPELGRLIALHAPSPGAGPTLRVCGSFDEAFAWAAGQSSAGDVILLSPACASYDWFRHFGERGDLFARLARAWRPGDASESGAGPQ